MMKYNLLYTLALLLLFACEEIPPIIEPGGGGSDTTVQRRVLVEELTGERCVNCPAGHQALESLKQLYGDRLVIVSIHAGFFAVPYPQSDAGLANPEGNAVLNYLGAPLGYPAAVVNRRLFAGEERLAVGQAQWPGYINDVLKEAPVVEVDIATNYLAPTRNLQATVTLTPLAVRPEGDLLLSVFLVEDKVRDPQETPTGVDPDYEHRHVFRASLSLILGNRLAQAWEVGEPIRFDYNVFLPDNWVGENSSLVAFVHRDGDDKEVLQVNEEKLVP